MNQRPLIVQIVDNAGDGLVVFQLYPGDFPEMHETDFGRGGEYL